MPLKLQDTDADFPALYLANFLLGTSETSRLWSRVRETDGLSYNVRSNLSVSSFEPTASWTIYAIYAPQNRERLEKAIDEELEIGRAHVCTPVTNAPLVCRLLLAIQNITSTIR